MLAGHLEIKEVDEGKYIVNNTITNRFIKLGIREVNYLLSLKGLDVIKGKDYEPLSSEQEAFLHKKFEEWKFLKEESVQKNKRDLSNIILISFDSAKWFEKFMSKFKVIISPGGLTLLLCLIVFSIYAFYFEAQAILDGVNSFTINFQVLVMFYLLNFFTGIVHECCHATACYKYSGKCGKIGIKLLYLLPAYFCDVSNMYMVKSRKKKVIVSSAGLAANSVIGNLSLFIYIMLYKQGIVFPFLLYSFCYNIFVIIFNLNPFAKFDGYWILKAASGIENLYDKSILTFFMMILTREKLISKKKCILSLYGSLIFLFHWLFWGYAVYLIYEFIIGKIYFFIAISIVIILSLIALKNCIDFTRKYFRIYKNNY